MGWIPHSVLLSFSWDGWGAPNGRSWAGESPSSAAASVRSLDRQAKIQLLTYRYLPALPLGQSWNMVAEPIINTWLCVRPGLSENSVGTSQIQWLIKFLMKTAMLGHHFQEDPHQERQMQFFEYHNGATLWHESGISVFDKLRRLWCLSCFGWRCDTAEVQVVGKTTRSCKLKAERRVSFVLRWPNSTSI